MVLVIAGTVAIHTILLVFVDAMIVTHPIVLKPPAPVIEMVEVEVEPPPPPKPPEEPPPPDEPEPQVPQTPQPPQPQPRVARTPQVQTQPQTPPPETPNPSPPGGDPPTIPMPDLAPGGRGIPIPAARGKVPGRGGSGGGSGTGTGSGSGDPPAPAPVSVATIKTRALPKGDYGYFDAGKEYPAEARTLGIEGTIRVKLVVDAAGKVTSAVLLNKLGHGLDELALARAKKIEFEPAKDTDDKPVTSVVIWTFNMTLPK